MIIQLSVNFIARNSINFDHRKTVLLYFFIDFFSPIKLPSEQK